MSKTTRTKAKPVAAPQPEKMLLLRTCDSEMKSYEGFQWPESGPVECPDWSPEPKCGNGLHGLPWGQGDWSLLNSREPGRRWIVWEADASEVVDIDGKKSKAPRGNVLIVLPNWWSAMAYISARHKMGDADSAEGEGCHAAASGDYGHAAASGYSGHAAASGYSGHAAASGDYGHAAASGYCGHAAASGDYGHACVLGYAGRAKAGPNGLLALAWHDGTRGRLTVGYTGEDGIEANVWYCVENGKLAKAENHKD